MRTFRFILLRLGALAPAFALCLGGYGIAIAGNTNPVLIGSWPSQGITFDVAVSGGYAYLAEENGRLEVIDVSNRVAPRKVGDYECQTNAAVFGVTVSGTYAYLKYLHEARLEVVDIANPLTPKYAGWYDPQDSFFRTVAVSGQYAYLGGAYGLQVIDVSQAADPRRVSGSAGGLIGYTLDNGGGGNLYQRVAVGGTHAYVANGAAGLLVLDISNPTNITKLGELKTKTSEDAWWEDDWWVALSGHVALLADSYDLYTIDISNPADPLLLGRYEFAPWGCAEPCRMAVAGNYVCLGMRSCMPGPSWLLVLDISNPAQPQQVGDYVFAQNGGVAMSGNQIYLANGGDGLLLLEMQPFIKSIVRQDQDLRLSWDGFGVARLQRSTRLASPDWHDVPGSEATNNLTLPIEGTSAFFRLVKQ